jgi:hypothetical protein
VALAFSYQNFSWQVKEGKANLLILLIGFLKNLIIEEGVGGNF